MTREKNLMEKAEKDGTMEIGSGIFLSSQENIIADQKTWSDLDDTKETDLTTSPFWVTSDYGCDPIGIDTEKELADFLAEHEL